MRIIIALLVAGLCLNLQADEVKPLPNVLIIGDSISNGYTPFVRVIMKERAVVVHAPGNSQSTEYALPKLAGWLGDKKWDVINFNWGLHDMKYINAEYKLVSVDKGRQWVPVEQYEKNLHLLVKQLKATGSQLVWCMTTPVPEGAAGRVPGEEVAYNAAARRVMESESVVINDLCAFIKPDRLKRGGRPKDVHYTKEGSELLAGEVVKYIDAALKLRK